MSDTIHTGPLSQVNLTIPDKNPHAINARNTAYAASEGLTRSARNDSINPQGEAEATKLEDMLNIRLAQEKALVDAGSAAPDWLKQNISSARASLDMQLRANERIEASRAEYSGNVAARQLEDLRNANVQTAVNRIARQHKLSTFEAFQAFQTMHAAAGEDADAKYLPEFARAKARMTAGQ